MYQDTYVVSKCAKLQFIAQLLYEEIRVFSKGTAARFTLRFHNKQQIFSHQIPNALMKITTNNKSDSN
jgi:hypothetical protein